MSQFNMIKGNLTDAAFQQMQEGVAQALAGFDYDSLWIPTPSDRRIEHGLDRQPLRIVCYASDDQDGDPMLPENWVSADKKAVVIAGTKKFCRVLVDI